MANGMLENKSKKSRKNIRRHLLIAVLVLSGGACSDNDDGFVDIDVPLNCTIPGELELESDTLNNLKKYQQLNDDLIPKASASPINPKKYNLD